MNSYGLYKDARNAAWQVLLDYDIRTLPVDVVGIAAAEDIAVINNKDVGELKPDEDGASLYSDGKWYIIYKDSPVVGRMRFTVAHELGHIFLGHPLIGKHSRRFDTEKPDIETQANVFASRLLAPACVLWGLDLHSAEDIANVCNISFAAAKIRAERMQELYKRGMFLTSPLERSVWENFKDYIDDSKKGYKWTS